VKGIKEPMILDLDDFAKSKKTPVSPHDYDLLFHLLLLKKIHRLGRVLVVGISDQEFSEKLVDSTALLVSQIEDGS